MHSLVRLTDFTIEDCLTIFKIADRLQDGSTEKPLEGKTVVMFFPESSIRTRISFEKGIHLLGGQSILFPPEALDKRERIEDVVDYLNNWADLIIVRHKSIEKIEEIARYSEVPVINAMTSVNHPCEMLTDLYALSKIREDYRRDRYLFCGARGNIGLAWKEASEVFGFELSQCCPKGYEVEGIKTYNNLEEAIEGKDVICTDSLPSAATRDFKDFQITKAIMDRANDGAVLNPCPPFNIGEEVSEDVINSDYFVGYGFKKHLLEVQQGIMIYGCL